MNELLHPLYRPAQHETMAYKSGRMLITAAPGSGKTFILAHLAASLVSRISAKDILKGREVLVVTFTNTAVGALKSRIAATLEHQHGLLPNVGYRVRTLHGLALDIVTENAGAIGLPQDFRVYDEVLSQQVIRDVLQQKSGQYLSRFGSYLSDAAKRGADSRQDLSRQDFPEEVFQIAHHFIRHCKDHLISPESAALSPHPLVQVSAAVYADYQAVLRGQGALDFDDLIVQALTLLNENATVLKRLQHQWPYVLEDETQDSSHLQEQMLRLLSAEKNWVRVGDPNQAINTTFTTANAHLMQAFAAQEGVTTIPMRQSGRSSRPISDLANTLVKWTNKVHPVRELRRTFDGELIEPTYPGDAQINPLSNDTLVHVHYQPDKKVSADEELALVAQSLKRWLPEHPAQTVAVLVPDNSRGYQMFDTLRAAGIPCDEALRSTSETRHTLRLLEVILHYLANPTDIAALLRVYREVWRSSTQLAHLRPDVETDGSSQLAACREIESYLYPLSPQADWLSNASATPPAYEDLQRFRIHVRRWVEGLVLPVDQLLLTIAHDIFIAPGDIALTYSVSRTLRSLHDLHPEWELPDFVRQLNLISQNQRAFLAQPVPDYNPQPGLVTVTTFHSAKGLEWDRVYLTGINNHAFPSAQPGDYYVSQRWYWRDNLNLRAEVIHQLEVVNPALYTEGEATEQSRFDYAAERLRLLYVGITRARHDLILLWNCGKSGQAAPALPLQALKEYLDGTLNL
jgi:DNA helicase-2/ATP-dependent DNA helicase PcrA